MMILVDFVVRFVAAEEILIHFLYLYFFSKTNKALWNIVRELTAFFMLIARFLCVCGFIGYIFIYFSPLQHEKKHHRKCFEFDHNGEREKKVWIVMLEYFCLYDQCYT
jgi:hypothetical protein